MDNMLLARDIPTEFVQSVLRGISDYTTGFLRVVDNPGWTAAELLGSGVFVSFGGKRVIITAAHVLDVLPRIGRMGLILGRTSHPHTVECEAVVPLKIARGDVDSEGPDIGVLILAPHVAGAISAKKSFFNLDKRRESMLADPLDAHDGAWFSQGYIQEGTKVVPDPIDDALTKYFYSFTGIGGPDPLPSRDGFDYFDFPVSHEGREGSPVDWGGMSGGGIWQVQFKKVDGQLTHLAPALSGIAFYQHPTSDTLCGIKAHGRQTIYDRVVRAIREP